MENGLMKNTALVTGASGGIGRELARVHARAGGDLVLVSRRQEALKTLRDELAEQHGVEVVCLPADLSQPGSVEQVFGQLEARGIEIDILINNAGFGGHGPFHRQPWETSRQMIELNITALCEMTRRVLPGMVARRRGRILNIGSTAGFLPGPLMAVYYASKAYVLSFSQAIHEEVHEHGITVTALCPGPVETDFFDRAKAKQVSMFKKGATAQSVAELGYKSMLQGRPVVINEWRLWWLMNWVTPHVPRGTLAKISRWLLSS